MPILKDPTQEAKFKMKRSQLLVLLFVLFTASSAKAQGVPQPPAANTADSTPRTYFKLVYVGMSWEEFIGVGHPEKAQENINQIHAMCQPIEEHQASIERRGNAIVHRQRVDNADKDVKPLTAQETTTLLACRSLLPQMANIAAGRYGVFPSPSSNQLTKIDYEFRDKKVYAINVFFGRTTFEDQLENLSSKYGKPNDVKDVPLQNGYGAKFTAQYAAWKMPDGTEISLYASPDGDHETATVQFKGAAALADDAKKYEASRKETNPY